MSYLVILSVLIFLVSIYVAININRAELLTSIDEVGLEDRVKKHGYSFATFFMFFTMILTAFRSANIGNDTGNYIRMFHNIQYWGIDFSNRSEIGYQIFEYLVGLISSDSQAILIASAVLIYGLYFKFIKEESYNPWMHFALFFFMMFGNAMNINRQVIAEIILLFAYREIIGKNYIYSLLILIVAVVFHKSAILFLLFMAVMNIKFRNKIFISFWGFILLLIFFTNSIQSLLLQNLPMYDKYMYSARVETGWLGVTYELLRIVFTICIYKYGTSKTERANSTKWLFALSLIFYSCGYIMNLFTRAGEIFFFIALFPFVNELIASKKRNASWLLLIILLFYIVCFLFVSWYRPEWNHIYPYEFCC